LVLGCTHYPYLIPQIKKIIPNHIRIIDSGEAVAKQTKHILEVNNLYNTSNEVFHSFFINNTPDVMQDLIGTSFKVDYKIF
jgi:glutamate racemase